MLKAAMLHRFSMSLEENVIFDKIFGLDGGLIKGENHTVPQASRLRLHRGPTNNNQTKQEINDDHIYDF